MTGIVKYSEVKKLGLRNHLKFISLFLKRLFRIKLSSYDRSLYQFFNFIFYFEGKIIVKREKEVISMFPGLSTNQVMLRLHPSSDLDVFQQIVYWKNYQPVVDLYTKIFPLRKDINIIDCGANIGLTALFFQREFPDSRIICIEPEKNNFEVLSFNVKPFRNKIIPVNAGVWKTNAKLRPASRFRDGKDWSFRLEVGETFNDISCYSIDQIMETFKIGMIDILKIDIEGAESEIFNFKNPNLKFLERTRCIVLEIHDEFKSRKEIISVLKTFGFDIFNQGELTLGFNSKINNGY